MHNKIDWVADWDYTLLASPWRAAWFIGVFPTVLIELVAHINSSWPQLVSMYALRLGDSSVYISKSSSFQFFPIFPIFFNQLAELIHSQVLRYSALAAGVFYGLYHQASLTAATKLSAINREYEHKRSLIEKAKAEYSKKNVSADKNESGDGTLKGFIRTSECYSTPSHAPLQLISRSLSRQSLIVNM